MSMEAQPSSCRSVTRYFLLLFGLCIPFWVIGAIYDIEVFPGFKLFQAGLAMPMIAALILTYHEQGLAGIAALLRRTYDVRTIKPKTWWLPILFLFPGVDFINYWILRHGGADIPSPVFSLIGFLGYSTVFLMTYGEELGLTGYAIGPMQERYSALVSGLLLGLVWAGYHVPGFLISGYYSTEWIVWHVIYIVASRVLLVWIYNNSGRSLFSMAMCHWTFGIFWSLWPQDNLQKAVPFYRPQITAGVAIVCVLTVVSLWGPGTLARFRFARR